MNRRDARRNEYLESKVLTAPGPRLHLMLVEGAMRWGQQAQGALTRNDDATVADALQRAIDIAAELLAGVRHSSSPVNTQLTAVYRFILRALAQAYFDRDPEKIAEALRVLEVERGTWQQVCERLAPAAPIAPDTGSAGPALGAGLSYQA